MKTKGYLGIAVLAFLQIAIGLSYDAFFVLCAHKSGLAIGENIDRGIPLRFLALAILYLLLILTGIGLLMRKNWARLVSLFVGPVLMGWAVGKLLLFCFWFRPFWVITLTKQQIDAINSGTYLVCIAVFLVFYLIGLTGKRAKELFL